LLAPSIWSALGAAKPEFPAAMLVPKTGEHAALGRSMERAAMLAQGPGEAKQFRVFDTLGTPEGAIAAARLARRGGARILLGPIFATELRGVVAVAGPGVPVISFSNDASLRESGAFVFGITAAQIVTALLRYGAGRGIRRVAVAPGTAGGWSVQVAQAAAEAARPLGLEVVTLPALWGEAGSNSLPDAVLITDSDQLPSQGPALTKKGVQVLGAITGLDLPPETLHALDGAWFAAPDPAGFASFARAFEERVGSQPGLITGLAYDAMHIVEQLRMGGGVDRSALLAATGFKGVCGDVRFREDGSAARSLAILAVKSGNLASVAPA
jgi:ABC-type branched-subunit amino acid transport system substrate-binding protein